MTSQDLYDLFRTDVVDTARPYLWTDDEVYRYMDDAYRMFVRLTGGIADFSSDLTQLSISADQDIYDVDRSILRIMSAVLLSTGQEVKVINAAELPSLSEPVTDYGQVRTLSLNNSPGEVRWMVTGMQRNKVKLIKIPLVDDTLSMFVYRLPLVHVTDGSHLLNEIEEDHHFHLLKWMKSLAYQKQDTETFDKVKSTDAENAFRAYCLQSKAEWERYKHKTRVVSYGGI